MGPEFTVLIPLRYGRGRGLIASSAILWSIYIFARLAYCQLSLASGELPVYQAIVDEDIR
jgi:hypothetical protein